MRPAGWPTAPRTTCRVAPYALPCCWSSTPSRPSGCIEPPPPPDSITSRFSPNSSTTSAPVRPVRAVQPAGLERVPGLDHLLHGLPRQLDLERLHDHRHHLVADRAAGDEHHARVTLVSVQRSVVEHEVLPLVQVLLEVRILGPADHERRPAARRHHRVPG